RTADDLAFMVDLEGSAQSCSVNRAVRLLDAGLGMDAIGALPARLNVSLCLEVDLPTRSRSPGPRLAAAVDAILRRRLPVAGGIEHGSAAAADRLQEHAVGACPGCMYVEGTVGVVHRHLDVAAISACDGIL